MIGVREIEAARANGRASQNGNGWPDGRSLSLEAFAGIRAEATRWLWQGRIPLGTATLLVGREGLGKSTLTVELAARLSRGELPGDLAGTPADAVILSYEDSARRTIKPRLLAAGADLDRVHRLVASDAGAEDLVSLPQDVEAIDTLAAEVGARLVIVDPLSASLGTGVNNHRDQDVRRALAPLVTLAERADLAIVVLSHWNKAQGEDPLARVLGSRGLTAAVRSVLAFGVEADGEDGPGRVLAHAKCNVGPPAPSLACRIEGREVEGDTGSPIETSRLVLGEETEASAADLLATRGEDERTDRDVAAEWLADELADGEWHEARAIKAEAKAAGIAERTLHRARGVLNVENRREGFPAVSEWRLPVVPPTPGTTATGQPGTTVEKPDTEPDTGSRPGQSCHVSDIGTTGGDEAAKPPPDQPDDDLADLDVERAEQVIAEQRQQGTAGALPAERCQCESPRPAPDPEDGELRCTACGHVADWGPPGPGAFNGRAAA